MRRTFSKAATKASHVLPTSDLFIVDNNAMREALSIAFTLIGYRAIGFTDAEAFVAAARSDAPACDLRGLHLPDKSSELVLQALDARSFPAPIFIVTGDDDENCVVQAIKNETVA